jgi:serine/threonine protein phosphatase 1
MTLQARDERSRATTWRHGNGGDLLSSYGFTGQSEWWNLIPAAHWQFLERTTPYFETARHIFVHASLDPEIDLADQPDWVIYWERFETIRPHKSGKKIICGHTPSRDGEIKDVGYAACIDTAAVAGRWLTCLDANTGQYWQANQTSTTRTARLPNWQ